MTSRLTSEARIPSWPIEMPSDTVIVPNSSGHAAGLADAGLDVLGERAQRHVARRDLVPRVAMPICGLSQSSSVSPTARSIARAAAFWHAVGDVAGAGLDVDGLVSGHGRRG